MPNTLASSSATSFSISWSSFSIESVTLCTTELNSEPKPEDVLVGVDGEVEVAFKRLCPRDDVLSYGALGQDLPRIMRSDFIP
jgi:hypothetical protein